MSELSKIKYYNLATTFIIKALIALLLVNSLFSGVDFSQIGLIKGLSSIADFGIKIALVLMLFILFKIPNRNIIYIGIFFIFPCDRWSYWYHLSWRRFR